MSRFLPGTKAEQQALARDPERLADAIRETHGFILEQLKNRGVVPELGFLLGAHFHLYAAPFITENYALSEQEQKTFQDYLGSDGDSRPEKVQTAVNPQSEWEQIQALQEGVELDEEVVLTFDFICAHQEDLLLVLTRDDQDTSADRANRQKIAKSILALSTDQWLTLEDSLLLCRNDFFITRSGLLQNAKARQRFIDLAEKATNGKPTVANFKHYPFGPEEKDLAHRIVLNSVESSSYRKMPYRELDLKCPAISELISKVEYLKYNPWDLESFSESELETHENEIRLAWNGEVEKWGRRSSSASDLIQSDLRSDLIERFFDAKFVRDPDVIGYLMQPDRDQEEETRRYLILTRKVIESSIRSRSEGGSILYDFERAKESLEDYHEQTFREEETERWSKLQEVWEKTRAPQYGKTLDSAFLYTLRRNWKVDIHGGAFARIALETPGENWLLLFLTRWHQLNRSVRNREEGFVVQVLEKLMCKLGSADALKLAEHFHFPVPKNFVLNQDRPRTDFTENLLNYSAYSFETGRDDDLMEEIVNVDREGFLEHLLRQKIRMGDRMFLNILSSDWEESLKISFFRRYLELYPDGIAANERFLQHPLSSKVLEMGSTVQAQHDLGLLFERAILAFKKRDRWEVESEKNNKGYHHRSREKPLSAAEKKELEIRSGEFEIKEINETIKGWTFADLEQKTEEVLRGDDFSRIEFWLSLVSRTSAFNALEQKLFDKINATPVVMLQKWVSQESFRTLLKKNNTGSSFKRSEARIVFSLGTEKEKEGLARDLLPYFEDSESVFRLFPENQSFTPKLAIEKDPMGVLHNYGYNPKITKGYSSLMTMDYLVHRPYSNEEVLELFLNSEALGGIFHCTDINARSSDFLKANFDDRPVEYQAMLGMAAAHPKLYALLSQGVVLREVFPMSSREEDKKFSCESHRLMTVFMQQVDFAKVLEGMKCILEELSQKLSQRRDIEDPKEALRFNSGMARQTIKEIIWTMDYEDMEKRGEYHSILSQEQTEAVFSLLWKYSPYLLMDLSSIGGKKVRSWVSGNFSKMVKGQSIEEVIHQGAISNTFGSDFNFSGYRQKTGEATIEAWVDFLVHHGEQEDLQYLQHLKKIHDFMETHFRYGGGDRPPEACHFQSSPWMRYIQENPHLLNPVESHLEKKVLQDQLLPLAVSDRKRSRF